MTKNRFKHSCLLVLGGAASMVTLFIFLTGYSSVQDLWDGLRSEDRAASAGSGGGPEEEVVEESHAPATVFVYRRYKTGFAVKWDLYIDGDFAGELSHKSYLEYSLKPGEYDFQIENHVDSWLRLQVRAGGEYYIRQEISFWTFSFLGSPRLVEVSAKVGRREIVGLKPLSIGQ